MAHPLILSLGSANADFQVGVDRYPSPGETLPAGRFLRAGGGKAANVCLLATRLGVGARLLASLGDDDLREQVLRPLRAAGVDLSAIGTAPGQSTGVALIFVPPDGKKGIVLAGNANDHWDGGATEAAIEVVRQAPEGSVLVADHEVPGDVVRACVAAAAERGFPLVIDPSPANRVDRALFRHAAAITPNPAEAEGLTGIEVTDPASARRAAEQLAGQGGPPIYLKMPDGGCLLYVGGRGILLPAEPVEVVDTTGAGDAFAGALAVALLEGREPGEAACFAVAASHIAVTRFGSQDAYPDRAAVDRMARQVAAGARHV